MQDHQPVPTEPQTDARSEQLATWCQQATVKLGRFDRMQALPREASFRRFHRVYVDDANNPKDSSPEKPLTLIAIDAPPDLENNEQFAAIGERWHSQGIPVAKILARDKTLGFFLVDDLGTQRLGDRVRAQRPEHTLPLYERAIDALLRIQQQAPDPIYPAYSEDRLRMEVALFQQWIVDALQMPWPSNLNPILNLLVENAMAQPACCIHRDFQSHNIMISDSQPESLALVDYQDALWGPVSYDLASLLRDCYVPWDVARDEALIDQFVRESPIVTQDTATFTRVMERQGIQRNAKNIGIFMRLCLDRGRDTHLQYILPTVQGMIDICQRDKDLQLLGNWFENTAAPILTTFIAERGTQP